MEQFEAAKKFNSIVTTSAVTNETSRFQARVDLSTAEGIPATSYNSQHVTNQYLQSRNE